MRKQPPHWLHPLCYTLLILVIAFQSYIIWQDRLPKHSLIAFMGVKGRQCVTIYDEANFIPATIQEIREVSSMIEINNPGITSVKVCGIMPLKDKDGKPPQVILERKK